MTDLTKNALHLEPHQDNSMSHSNWLRAAVLGANDGIVSVAALVVGVAGATSVTHDIFIAGIAGLFAGAFSMAVGEFVSVSSQRDTEKALLAKERYELEHFPDEELEELTKIYEGKGLNRATAEIVARELTAHDAFGAHVEAELGIDPNELTSAWQAAFASAASFTIGAIIPLAAILLPPENYRVAVTFASVLFALTVTGILSARVSKTRVLRVVFRMVAGGGLAMIVTFMIGTLFQVPSV
ncbi:MAG: VIT family protein [Candidatus Pacebacteria bacterium]|nr:VIT family protein [Candidatus Paceibacterota bacterium]